MIVFDKTNTRRRGRKGDKVAPVLRAGEYVVADAHVDWHAVHGRTLPTRAGGKWDPPKRIKP